MTNSSKTITSTGDTKKHIHGGQKKTHPRVTNSSKIRNSSLPLCYILYNVVCHFGLFFCHCIFSLFSTYGFERPFSIFRLSQFYRCFTCTVNQFKIHKQTEKKLITSPPNVCRDFRYDLPYMAFKT